jgi:hypothetical protein
MNVEGYELKALQGATETLQKHQPMLVLEFHIKKDKTKTDAILSFFSSSRLRLCSYFQAKIFFPRQTKIRKSSTCRT